MTEHWKWTTKTFKDGEAVAEFLNERPDGLLQTASGQPLMMLVGRADGSITAVYMRDEE